MRLGVHLSAALLSALAVYPASAQSAGDWPQFKGGSSRTAFNADEATISARNVSTLRKRWAVPMDFIVDASPVVAGGLVYIGTDTRISAFDVTNGALAWTRNFGVDFKNATPAVADGVLYVGEPEGRFFALNASTGASQWRRTFAGGILGQAPLVANGLVYVAAARGDLNKIYALDAATGRQVWRRQLRRLRASSMSIDGGVLFAPVSRNPRLRLFDAATGELISSIVPSSDDCSDASIYDPVSRNGRVFFGCGRKTFGFDLKTGRKIWSVDGTPRTIAIAGASVVVAYGDRIRAFAVDTGELLWTAYRRAAEFRGLAIANDVVFATSSDSERQTEAFDLRTGQNLWSTDGDRDPCLTSSQPAVADGVLYTSCLVGGLNAYDLPPASQARHDFVIDRKDARPAVARRVPTTGG